LAALFVEVAVYVGRANPRNRYFAGGFEQVKALIDAGGLR
jgi:hypothetical protein